VLINNAGIMPIGEFASETDSTAQRMVDINLHGVLLGSKLALESFIPRRHGHIVQLASAAGKWGIAGGATYCATKHAVVGLSEALHQELRGTGIELSVVMPTVVNTELGSGLPRTRAFKAVEPEDAAAAIVEALQTGRFNVYVPKSMGATVRFSAIAPRPLMDAIGRLLKGDQVLSNPDHAARAAYEARMAQTIEAAALPSEPATEPPSEPATEPPSEPATEPPSETLEELSQPA
jgi:short-subunit dehydrogenase